MKRELVRGTFAAVIPLFLSVAALASDPWDGAPFSADPKAMLAAASQVTPREGGVVVFLDEVSVTLDAQGLATRNERIVYRVVDESAVEEWSAFSAGWSPWYEEQPKVQARVIAADGSVHQLDPKSFSKEDAEDEPDMFTDTRLVSGPLPAVGPGSVVEQLITYRQKNTLYEAGTSYRHDFTRWVDRKETRFSIEYPSSIPFHLVNHTKPEIEPARSEANGVTKLVFDLPDLPAVKMMESGVPADASDASYVAFSTGKSWQDVATRYAAIVDAKLAPSDAVVKATASAGVGNAKDPRAIAEKLLAKVEQGIRYAGVEFGEGSIVPRTPAETLAHKYGDCKDKATLLVAMLRQAGVPAHVALLFAGGAADVDPELPGLGRFNHVIVYVPGDKPLWLDPTDEYARAGELPEQDQGRRALIASDKTTALATIPIAEAGANRSVETREFVLAEDGRSSPVETTEYYGAQERALRRFYATLDAKKAKEQLEKYAKENYLADELGKYSIGDPHDLTKPFRVSVQAVRARRGNTNDGEAAVGIFAAALVGDVPWELKQSDEQRKKFAAHDKPRQHDFEFARPFVAEVRHRIVPPPGYVLRQKPKDETIPLGTASLTKTYTLQPDGVLLTTYKFDSGPRRITAAQFEEMRQAMSKFAVEPALIIFWDQNAKKLLEAGEVGKAIAELRKLSAQHPKEALHHAEIASVLLQAGFGTAARAEAKAAIDLEPNSAKAHRMYARTLMSDPLGREFGKGFDGEATIREYRKAKELDPKDVSARAELAGALERNAEGVQWAKGAKIDDAIAEYLALKDPKSELDINEEAVDRELMVAYLNAGRFKELKELAAKTKDTEKKDALGLAATAMVDGPPAAVTQSESLETVARRERLTGAAGVLMVTRHYAEAAELMAAAAQGAPNAAELREQVDLLRRMKRSEDLVDKGEPQDVARRFFAVVAKDPEKAMRDWTTADVIEYFDDDRNQRDTARFRAKTASLGDWVGDAAIAAIQFQQDGSEETGYRLVGRPMAGASNVAQQVTLFVIRENGKYRIAGTNHGPETLALRALRLADAGKLDAARQWLDWAREIVHGSDGDDPLDSRPFAALWTRGNKTADAAAIRLAAASLLPSTKKATELAIPILEPARATAPAELQFRVDVALAAAYEKT